MLLSILGQSSFEIDTTSFETTTTTDAGAAGVFLFVWFALLVGFYVLMALSVNKILKKAGHPNDWAGWVPVYNAWTVAEVAGRPGWWSLVGLLSAIPIVNFFAWIAVLVVQIIVSLDLAKSFGKSGGFAALLILLPVVGFPVLGFGDAQYQGAAGPEGDAFKQNGTTPPNNPQAPTPPAGPEA